MRLMASAGTAWLVSCTTSRSPLNSAPSWLRHASSTAADAIMDTVPMSTLICVLSHAWRGRDAPAPHAQANSLVAACQQAGGKQAGGHACA